MSETVICAIVIAVGIVGFIVMCYVGIGNCRPPKR